MASVHLARMDGPGGFQKWVAIKRIHPNLVEDDQFVDMFLDEARIAAGINHANVAQVFDLGKDEGTYWIAMEYLHGEPLRELMRRCEERNSSISCDIAARMCADAAEGLHSAHELRGKNNQLLGLVHRDVTPHNLFITYDGYTKVVDFGIAKVADRLSETRAGTLKGKLAYMSPEQVRGQDDVDRTTDIFALGVVLWELTTGHRLFRMDTDLDTLEKVQACVVPPPSTIVPNYPIELESVVMKALAKKKPERYQTAREFSRALQMYLQRRATLIGPEEVSVFVRELFADRIKAREAHLAWAADVTSTINIDQLNAMKAGRGPRVDMPPEDISMKSISDAGDDGPRTMAMSADIGKPSLPGSGVPSIRPSTNGAMDAPASRRPPPAPPTVPHSPSSKAQPGQPNVPQVNVPRAGSVSLVDDDEDIPTTVATRDQMRELSNLPAPPPRPAAGGPPAGGFASIRATTMGVGAMTDPNTSNGAQQGAGGSHPLGGTVSMAPNQHSGAPGQGQGHYGQQASQQHQGHPQQGYQQHGHHPQQGHPQAHGQQGYPHGHMGHGQHQQAHPGHQSGQHALNVQSHGQHAGQQAAPSNGPTFGPPPTASSQGGFNPHANTVAIPQQQAGYYGAQNPGQSAPAFGPPPGQQAPGYQSQSLPGIHPSQLGQPQGGGFPSPPAQPAAGGRPPPSAVETALSLPRPDPQTWGANPGASARNSDRMSTAVLVTVAVLTAICVLALGALIYFKYHAAPSAPAGALEAPSDSAS